MTWFRVDDGFYDHPKVVQLFDDPEDAVIAIALWAMAGSWASKQLTDGVVPAQVLRRLLPGVDCERGAAALVRVGLWREEKTKKKPAKRARVEYHFLDWSDWNPTKDQVEKKRAEGRKRAKDSYERKKAAAQRRAKNSDSAAKNSDSAAQTPGVSAPTRPDPTRPDPIQDPPNPQRGKKKRGSRSWDPTEDEHKCLRLLFDHVQVVLLRDHGIKRTINVNKTNGREPLARLRDGIDLDTLKRGFEARSEEARRKPEQLDYLDTITPYRESVWGRTEAMIARLESGPKPEPPKTNGVPVGWVRDDLTGEPRWQDQWGARWDPEDAPADAPPPPPSMEAN